LAIAACGSTAPVPSGPSPVSQYPSVVGDRGQWREDNSSLVLRYRDSTDFLFYNCDTTMNIPTQADGAFSGLVELQGVDPRSDKQCTYSSAFSAQMTADGTVTSFHLERSFLGGDCTPAGQATVRGTATSTSIRLEITDRPTCKDPAGQLREFDRTLTLGVHRPQ
jgi:hypothetical protein